MGLRKLEEVLDVSLLRFGHALQLVGASFGPLFLIAGQGTRGFFNPPLDLVHRPRYLISVPTTAQDVRSFLGPLSESLRPPQFGSWLRLSPLRLSFCRP